MYLEAEMLRTRTSLSTANTERSTNSGTLSTLMNGRENQERESSMKKLA
jgi:hypothetical protein